MNIDQLRYFLLVCDHGSMLRASQKAYISQQALSKSIAALEKDIGEPLFYRTSKGLNLTTLGLVLQEQSRTVIDSFDKMTTYMQEVVRANSGRLSIGFFPGFLYWISLNDWHTFTAEHPNISFKAKEYRLDLCREMVKNGDIDAAITVEVVDDRSLTVIPLALRKRVVLLRKDHPLAFKKQLQFNDLCGQQMIICANNICAKYVENLCQQYQLSMDSCLWVSETLNMYECCNDNDYVGLSIDFIADRLLPRFPNLVCRTFSDNAFAYPVSLIIRTDRSNNPSIPLLIDFIKARVPDTLPDLHK